MTGEKEKRGTIRAVNPDSKTLTLRGHGMRRHEIAWLSNTQVLRNGKPVGPEALRKGERVTVTARKEGGRLIASEIIISERREARVSRHTHQPRD